MLLTYNIEIEIPHENTTISAFQSLPTMREAKEKLMFIHNGVKQSGYETHWVDPDVFAYIDENTDESIFVSITETKTNTFTNQQVKGI